MNCINCDSPILPGQKKWGGGEGKAHRHLIDCVAGLKAQVERARAEAFHEIIGRLQTLRDDPGEECDDVQDTLNKIIRELVETS